MTQHNPLQSSSVLYAASCFGTFGLILLSGCSSPIAKSSEDEMRRAMILSVQREVEGARGDGGTSGRIDVESTTDLTKLEIREDHLEQIQKEYSTAGYIEALREQDPGAEDPILSLVGQNLLGAETALVGVNLEGAVRGAVRNNLEVEFARYGPAISQSALVEAEAAFDWTLFGSVTGNDSIIPQTSAGAFGTGVVRPESDGANAEVGLRRALTTGGSLSVSHGASYTNVEQAFFGAANPNPSNAANFVVDFNQPLLDGFGRDSALAQVYLARNAERGSVVTLKEQLIDTASETERAYWRLVLAYKELVIRSKLLERGIAVRDDIQARRVQDARQAQVADAVARVERRRSDVLTAQSALRNASDALKRLINDERMPVGSEVLLAPAATDVIEPISYSLVDAISTGIKERPEIERALLQIDDATIRENVAKNGRLPTLDFVAQARMLGLDDSVGDSYDDSVSNRFVDDWLVGLTFEQPLGNRAGEAGYRRTRLERLRSIVGYRGAVQGVVLEIKNALNAVVTNAQLIGQTRLSRVAQGEALRTLGVEKELTNLGYSVERLNLELNQQETLASAEIAEAAAVVNYNIALVDLYAAMGTTLSRNRIDFVAPDANQLVGGESIESIRDLDSEDDGARDERGDD